MQGCGLEAGRARTMSDRGDPDINHLVQDIVDGRLAPSFVHHLL